MAVHALVTPFVRRCADKMMANTLDQQQPSKIAAGAPIKKLFKTMPKLVEERKSEEFNGKAFDETAIEELDFGWERQISGDLFDLPHEGNMFSMPGMAIGNPIGNGGSWDRQVSGSWDCQAADSWDRQVSGSWSRQAVDSWDRQVSGFSGRKASGSKELPASGSKERPLLCTCDCKVPDLRDRPLPCGDYSQVPVSARRQVHGKVPAATALKQLKDGNERFAHNGVSPKFSARATRPVGAPIAAVIGCADDACNTEVIFDAQQGELFMVRNVGNTVTANEGTFFGSLEYSVGGLGVNLIVVLGHTGCGAITGATKRMLDGMTCTGQSELRTPRPNVLANLVPAAVQAQRELPEGSRAEEIAERAVHVNVFNTIEKLFAHSEPIRAKSQEGVLQVHGAVYDTASGKVDFLGQHPRLPYLLGSSAGKMLMARDTVNASI